VATNWGGGGGGKDEEREKKREGTNKLGRVEGKPKCSADNKKKKQEVIATSKKVRKKRGKGKQKQWVPC